MPQRLLFVCTGNIFRSLAADAALIHGRYEQPDDLLTEMHGYLRRVGAPQSEIEALSNASMPVRPLPASKRSTSAIPGSFAIALKPMSMVGRSRRACEPVIRLCG